MTSRPVCPSDTAPTRVPTELPAKTAAEQKRRYSSEYLFGSCTEVEIEHGTSVYRLRRTSLGKLILTK